MLGEFRKHFADFDAGLAVLAEGKGRGHRHAAVRAGDGLAVHLGQHRLRIPRIDMRGRALRKDMDDVLGLGGKGRCLGRERIHRLGGGEIGGRQQAVAHQGRETERAETHARALEKFATREEEVLGPGRVFREVFVCRFHGFNNIIKDEPGEPLVSRVCARAGRER